MATSGVKYEKLEIIKKFHHTKDFMVPIMEKLEFGECVVNFEGYHMLVTTVEISHSSNIESLIEETSITRVFDLKDIDTYKGFKNFYVESLERTYDIF